MITTLKTNDRKRISSETKLNIALAAITRKQTIADISNHYDCSRTTVYKQQDKVLAAANKVFNQDDENVLFYIPVTKTFIAQVVIALFLICKSSYRDIMFFMQAIFNYDISLGGVFNIIEDAAEKAIPVNQSYDLSQIKVSASDEVFHWNKPILTTVDIDSRFCALLARADSRDYETWGIHLLDLIDQGYAPDTTILDGASGLVKGHEEVLANTRIRHDHFHIIKDMKDCGMFLQNEIASTVTETLKLYNRANRGRNEIKKSKFTEAWNTALTKLGVLEDTYKTFQLLVHWLQYDVLQLAGYPPGKRAILYDFIISEMEIIMVQHPHRIKAIIASLQNQRVALLDVANTLNDEFNQIATKYKLPLATIWEICYLARYNADSFSYNEKANTLESHIGVQYEDIEDDILLILASTHRCSSMVENLNSRVRPYLNDCKMVTQKHLDLIKFYLNHKPFMRSKHERLVNKTPAEAMTGKTHKPWLQMLGFTCWYNQTTHAA